MSGYDLAIAGLLALFIGIGALRGTARELLSLAVWLIAILCGWLFADPIATWFTVLEDAELRRLLAFIVIVPVMLAVLSLAAFVLRMLLPRPAPDLTSRMIGGVLGGLRGAAVVVVLLLLAGLTNLPKKDSWRESSLVEVFLPVTTQMLEWLPSAVARQFRHS
jgi:membrane protein required for colicin V production